jgi:hypothetical protein
MNVGIANAPIDNKIALGFVTYQPEQNFTEKLKTAAKLGFMLYVFDNSPKLNLTRDICKTLKNCKYITCGKNVGLGFGISSVCAQAYYDSHSALLFFDQDTNFNGDTLDFIQNFHIRNNHLAKEYSAIIFNSKINGININGLNEVKDVLFGISSGSLFYLKNLEILNWHNTNYFVDCVDYEFCLNSDNNNFKIGEYINTPGFDHITGQPDNKYLIFGKERFLRKYSKNRFFDYLLASFKLIFQSIKTMNFKYTKASFRSLLIYLYFQFIIRIIKFYEKF